MRQRPRNTVRMRRWLQVVCVLILAMAYMVREGGQSAQACNNCETVDAAPTATLALNGTDRLASYTLSLTVSNLGVTGWNVTITSSPFATSGSPTHTLAANASTITGVTEQCTTGNLCVTNPTNQVTYPIALPAGSPAPTAAKLYNATALTGVGTFTLVSTVTVAVPANAYAGAYQSTLTLAYVTGP